MNDTPFHLLEVLPHTPLYARVNAYRDDYESAHRQLRAFAQSIGAESYYAFPASPVRSFRFPNPRSLEPDAKPVQLDSAVWTKPFPRTGARSIKRTKAGKAFIETHLKQLPVIPTTSDYVNGYGLYWNIGYNEGEGKGYGGSGLLNHRFEPSVSWVGTRFFVEAPHLGEYVAQRVAEREYAPGTVWSVTDDEGHSQTLDPVGWTWPEGVRRVSQVEYDYIFAEHRWRKEQEATQRLEPQS